MESAHFVAVYIDGASIPKKLGRTPVWGIILLRDGAPIETKGGIVLAQSPAKAASDVAECHAFTSALKEVKRRGWEHDKVVVFTASQQLHSYMMEGKRISPRLLDLCRKAKALRDTFPDLEIRVIPRTQNKVAHRVTRAAYNEGRLAQLKKR